MAASRKLSIRSSINPNAGKIRGLWYPPAVKYFNVGGGIEEFELRNEEGFRTKKEAQLFAAEWKTYPEDARARVLKIKDRYYVYVN